MYILIALRAHFRKTRIHMEAMDGCIRPLLYEFWMSTEEQVRPRGNIVKHSRFKLANGSHRRRYRCNACGKAFVSTRGTPYYRLRCSRSDFDEVGAMSMEGMSISAIARVKGRSWNTVARWLERAAVAGRKFNDVMTNGYEMKVVKTRRKDRAVRVDRKRVIGSEWQLDEALWRSEDSEKLNTVFIKRVNLTIRQGSAYLSRKSPCHARCAEHLAGHLALLPCHYDFIRPHRGLKFGTELRTPTMQAGLATRRLTFREILTGGAGPLFCIQWILDFGKLRTTRKHPSFSSSLRPPQNANPIQDPHPGWTRSRGEDQFPLGLGAAGQWYSLGLQPYRSASQGLPQQKVWRAVHILSMLWPPAAAIVSARLALA